MVSKLQWSWFKGRKGQKFGLILRVINEVKNLILECKRGSKRMVIKSFIETRRVDLVCIKSLIKTQKVDLVCLQKTKAQVISIGLTHSLGASRLSEWGAANSGGAAGGILIFWDLRVLELVGMEIGEHSITYHFKNCDGGFVWIFTCLRRDREVLWVELRAIKGL